MIAKFAKKPASPQKLISIQECLKEQLKLLKETHQVLGWEFDALKSRNLDRITQLAIKKQALMQKVIANDQRLKLHPDKVLLQTDCNREVEAIKELLVSCKKRNDINGRLIQFCLAANHRLSMALMKTRDLATKNLTYTEEGQTIARGLNRVNLTA